MQILFLNQFFWPDTAATGQLLSDVTDHLSATGDQVSVICGSANYSGTAGAPPREATPTEQTNIDVTRLNNSAFSRKVSGRMGSYLSFLGGALWHGMRGRTPDVVVTLTTPPLLSLVGMTIQKARGARHVIWEMDVYPDVAVDLGVLKAKGLPARFFGWLADLPRKNADTIMVLGECMRDRLLAHGIPAEKIRIAENWADRADSVADAAPKPLPFPKSGLSVLYSGNFGMAHDVDTVAAALLRLNGIGQDSGKEPGGEGPSFVFAGGGSRYGWLKEYAASHELKNATFLPYCERQELNARLASGHIGLVSQKNECLGSAVPSKTYGIMAAGRPILFIGPKQATPAKIIERFDCGWQVECGDVDGLVSLLERLRSHPDLVVEAGIRSHQAFVAHYQRSIGVARIANILGSEAGFGSRAAGTAWAKPSRADS